MIDKDITKKIQTELVKILSEFDKLMKKENIKYFLACGSALGCIRHEGFIPWDDDLDIYIYSKDYEKLKKVIKKSNSKNLMIHDYNEIKNYPYFFPKIVNKNTKLIEKNLVDNGYECGIYIDIFPLFEADKNIFKRKLDELKRYLCYVGLRAHYYEFDNNIKKLVSLFIKKLIPINQIHKTIDKMYYKESNSKYLIDSGTFKKQALLQKNWFKETDNRNFEGYKIPIMYEYDEYLKHYYGNYMELPPKNKRISNHNFKVLEFDKEREE